MLKSVSALHRLNISGLDFTYSDVGNTFLFSINCSWRYWGNQRSFAEKKWPSPLPALLSYWLEARNKFCPVKYNGRVEQLRRCTWSFIINHLQKVDGWRSASSLHKQDIEIPDFGTIRWWRNCSLVTLFPQKPKRPLFPHPWARGYIVYRKVNVKAPTKAQPGRPGWRMPALGPSHYLWQHGVMPTQTLENLGVSPDSEILQSALSSGVKLPPTPRCRAEIGTASSHGQTKNSLLC